MADTSLPSHASVIVVGGGAMGCSTLYHLAKAGVGDAILLERNQLTSGTTWHSAAQVRALRSSRNLTELIRYSVALYSELEAETGQASGWINKGSLSIATTPDRMTHLRRQLGLARLYGVAAEEVSAGAAKERWPLMNADDVVGAVWSPDDGRVSPSDLCAALIKGARARGARTFEQTGVTAILTRNGRIQGVETARGTVTCDALAICTGLWSRETGAMAGVEIPVWPCEHFYLLTKPVPGAEGNLPTLGDHDGHLYIRDDSGGLLIGSFEPLGKAISAAEIGEDFAFGLLPEDWDHFEPMMENALHRLPVLAEAEVKMLLNGPECFTPDSAFLLGEAPSTRGIFLGCGMNSMGVASCGGAGMALARTIVEGHAPFDLSEVCPARFPPGLFTAEALAARAPEVLGRHYEIAHPGRQWSSARHLRLHPLRARFEAAGARFGQVYGWERPLVFGGAPDGPLTFGRPPWFDQVAAEVRHAHERVAMFDLSTFGKIDLEGADVAAFLDRVCANRMDRPSGRAVYTQMLNERGGIESDLTAVRLSETHYRLSVGTGAVQRDLSWLRRHLDDWRVTVTDRTADLATIGLMGPDAAGIVKALPAAEIAELGYFRTTKSEIAGLPVLAVRLSYVGEPGWEITCRAEHVPALWDLLADRGARPAGLYAQTSMRVEKRFLSYGRDIDSDTTPLEAGLDFAIGWDTNFVGLEALLRQRDAGVGNRIFTLVLEDPTAHPIGDEPVIVGTEIAGKTTSGTFGHRIGRAVAIAHIDPEAADEPVAIDIAGTPVKATLLRGAAFDPAGARLRAR